MAASFFVLLNDLIVKPVTNYVSEHVVYFKRIFPHLNFSMQKKSPARISGTGDRRFRPSGLCLKEILARELVERDKVGGIRNQSRRRRLNPGGGEVKRSGVSVAIGDFNRQRGCGRLARNVNPEHAETAELARRCADAQSFGRRARTHRRRVERNPAFADVFCACVASHFVTSRG